MSEKQKTEIYRDFDNSMSDQAPAHSDREKFVLACRILAANGHSENLAGQITLRSKEVSDRFLTLGFGYLFGEATTSHLCVVDQDLNVIDSEHTVTPALRFHMWLYRSRPDVQCLVHTHPPYTSALSMTGNPLQVAHMDSAMFHDDCAHLPEWPGVPFSDDEGRIIAAAIGNKRTILLGHHGLIAAGSCIEESVYLAVFLERAARLQLMAEASGPIQPITAENAKEAHDFLLTPSVVSATFSAWARRVGG